MKLTSSAAHLKTPGLFMSPGRSPRNATMRRTPAFLYRLRNPPMLSRVPSIQDRCGTTSMPVWLLVLSAVSMVPERVVPPAPKVTEKNAGLSAASGPRATERFSAPAAARPPPGRPAPRTPPTQPDDREPDPPPQATEPHRHLQARPYDAHGEPD